MYTPIWGIAQIAEQNRYPWRAVCVWPETGTQRRPVEVDGPGYSFVLNVAYDS
ncbi:hypothetical protein [Streptomyces sp. NPDC021969]|uniref:hypothetical protein n=1 Tax=unclassified Streptomyces TaxID=2593676 RepID=UPI0033F476EB